MKMIKSKRFQVIIFILFFSFLFFFIRVPLFRYPLFGEEGYFADVFLNQRQGPNYGYFLAYRINGINYYNIFQHPAITYEFLGVYGKIFQFIWPFKQTDVSTTLRFAFSLPQYFFWLCLIIVLFIVEARSKVFIFNTKLKALICIISISALAVTSSYELQIDNTTGIFITGIFSLLTIFYLIEEPEIDYKGKIFFLIIGFIQGMGKNEWSICFIAASILAIVYEVFQRKRNYKNDARHYYQIILLGLLGCCFGVIFNYLFDPQNYLAGLKLIFYFLSHDTNTWDLSQWFLRFKQNVYFLIPFIAILGVNLNYIRKNFPELNLLYIWSFTYAFILFGSYFFHQYEYIRYYSPLIPILTILLIYIVFKFQRKKQQYYFTLFLTLVIIISVFTGFLSIYRVVNRKINFYNHLSEFRENQINKAKKDGCFPVIDSAYGVFHQEIDFVGSSFSKEDIDNISRLAGKISCER